MPEVLDLTHDIHEGMTTYAAHWHPPVSIKQLGRFGFEGRETREITLGTHTGTQIDAPLHFVPGGTSIEGIPLSQLVGSVTIIDCRDLGANEVVTADRLDGFELEARVLFHFGWDRHWNTRKFYQDYPYFAPDAAQLLVDRGVGLVGMDTASPDDGRVPLTGDILGTEADSPIHKILLRNGVVIGECLTQLSMAVDTTGWILAALPIKVRGADGCPSRICLFKP